MTNFTYQSLDEVSRKYTPPSPTLPQRLLIILGVTGILLLGLIAALIGLIIENQQLKYESANAFVSD